MLNSDNPLGQVHAMFHNAEDSIPNNGKTVGFDDIRAELAKLKRKLSRSTDLRRNEEDKFGDGDQSTVKHMTFGDPADDLSTCWTNGCELGMILGCGPNPPTLGLSRFFMSCAMGLAKDVEAAIETAKAAGEEPLRQLIERRESLLHCSPLIACIAGARMIRDGHEKFAYWRPEQHARADHWAIANALIAAGANMEAKDTAGKTPLHHALSGFCTSLSRRIGLLLIEHGANVNCQDRFGTTLVHDPIIAADIRSMQLLMEAGADASIRNNVGMNQMTALNMWKDGMAVFTDAVKRGRVAKRARNGGLLTGRRVRLQGLQAAALNGKEGVCGAYNVDTGRYSIVIDGTERAFKTCNVYLAEETVDDANKCATCGKLPVGGGGGAQGPARMMRCGGCFYAKYCSADCQKTGWKQGHKKECKELSAQQIRISRPSTPRDITGLAPRHAARGGRGGAGAGAAYHDFDSSRLPEDMRTGRGSFHVKVQIPLLDSAVGMPTHAGAEELDEPLTAEQIQGMRDHFEHTRAKYVAKGDKDGLAIVDAHISMFEARVQREKEEAKEGKGGKGEKQTAKGKGKAKSKETDTPDMVIPIMLYNEDKSFVAQVFPGEDVDEETGQDTFGRLVTAVRQGGVAGVKAYLEASLVKDGSLLVLDVRNPLPAQAW